MKDGSFGRSTFTFLIFAVSYGNNHTYIYISEVHRLFIVHYVKRKHIRRKFYFIHLFHIKIKPNLRKLQSSCRLRL